MLRVLDIGAIGLLALGATAAPSERRRVGDKITGQIAAGFYNGTKLGCINSDFDWVTDESACETFTATMQRRDLETGMLPYKLQNSVGWGCHLSPGDQEWFLNCTEGSQGGGWTQINNQKPADGQQIQTDAYAFSVPGDCEASPLRYAKWPVTVNVPLNLNWVVKDGGDGENLVPTVTRAPQLGQGGECTSTKTVGPISTTHAHPTDVPFPNFGGGHLYVYHEGEKTGCLNERGNWIADEDSCAVFHNYNHVGNRTVLHSGENLCVYNIPEGPKHFACGPYSAGPEPLIGGWYLLNDKTRGRGWHAERVPEGDETSWISETEGDVDVQVKWWTLPN